ncbi:MAG: hypothetical protein ABIO70_05950 [Pseudomonadota bacterium]
MRSLPCALLALLSACTPEEGVLVLDPPSLDWGEIDFQQSMPLEGFDQREVNLINDGVKDLTIRIPGYDRVHLCLEGFEDQEGIVELPTLSPGSRYILLPAVCGYDVEAGEIGTTFHGRLQFVNDGTDPVELLEYSFTPVRHIGDDTGT